MAATKTSLALCSSLLLALGISVPACHRQVPEHLRTQPNGFVPVALADSPNMPPTCAQCPAGTCTTSAKPWCAGVRPPREWEERRAKEEEWWICQPVPEGCPVSRPEDGAPCSMDGQQCAYGACRFELARCAGGRWQRVENHPP